MYNLIATDMDGTFLRADMTYDEAKFAQLYQQLQQQQIQFVVASGNQYFQLRSFFEAYPDIIYLAENGAYIRDANQTYAIHAFEPATVTKILAQLTKIQDLHILVCGVKSAYALSSYDPQYVDGMRQYYHHLAVVDDFTMIDDQVLKIALSCPPEKTTAIVALLRPMLAGLAEPTSSGHGDIDLIQPGLNKAAGLKELGQHLNLDLSTMVAFGDGGNDLEMLREVGLGVAMQNAQPAVAAVADQQTTTNQEQGVLSFIDHLLTV
ncbi:HAD family hydrolase [Lactobacillus sp. CBA3606]|uniref:Cof-type HAD-IIB family hydrolase n=1 Tax=Lactobacillus sp. CBA3606 TaxID=2099789 RepID=UPI000CFB4849|nr:Cof-type HAD-IIB family hydrolase [Lactobacillus sp. CBA3606]AVK63782.1 HAD family hydrolase [Lactobacillus sp. CBA3606]